MLEQDAAGVRDRVLAEVAALFGVAHADLLSRCRDKPVAAARQTAMLALTQAGYTCTQTAALLERDHSTVLHGCNRARGHPDHAAYAAGIARSVAPYLHRTGEAASPGFWLAKLLPGIPPNDRASLAAYAAYLADDRPSAQAAYGLLLLRREEYREALETALQRSGESTALARLSLQRRNVR